MSSRDIQIVALALIPVVALVAAAAMLPLYRMPDGTVERHWVWDPPHMPVGNPYDRLSPKQFEEMKADPVQSAMLEEWKEMPRSMPIRPTFLGSRWSPDRNMLGWLAFYGVLSWVMFAGWKWVNR